MKVITLPKSFDENEIFLLVIAFALLIYSILLPKRFPIHVFLVLFISNSFIGRTVDMAIAIPPIDLYSSLDSNTHELFDEIIYSVIYPLYGYLFYYFYDKYDHLPTWASIITWSIQSCFLEWISTMINIFQYNKWHIIFSFFVYLFVFSFHSFFFKWVTKQFNYTSKRTERN
ncbi:hypothetical protein [Bacillus sp. SA1-12]|uniref:hypothetical protein n=1 Tax=Bacillus sp. SA1-12 TaxID=1455638 RepID=UPI000696B73F|nr:hypothetical protein [Bacillus sp. SA1-12]